MPDSPILTDLSEALIHAREVERVLMMIGNGEATPGQLPLDSLAKLISFTRYGRTQGATLIASADGLGPWTKHTCPVLAKAADDEPIFAIVAHDPTGPDVVQKWIEKNVDRLGPSHRKIVGAVRSRDAMAMWPMQKAAD